MSAQEAWRLYQRRWPVEVDNFYLKAGLGLADFRVQRFEAIDKWFAVTIVSLNYLPDQQAQCDLESNQVLSLADLIRQHRWLHLENTIRQIAQAALLTGNVEQVLQRHMPTV